MVSEQICELKVESCEWFQPKYVSLLCKGTVMAVETAHGFLNVIALPYEYLLYVQLMPKPCSYFFMDLMKHPTNSL